MLLSGIRMKASSWFIEDAFSDLELNSITHHCEQFTKSEAVIGRGDLDHKWRSSDICWIHKNDNNSWFFNKLDGLICDVNDNQFRFDIYNLTSFQYTTYYGNREGHYDWHIDSFTSSWADPSTKQRKLSVVIQLSDPSEYEGGNLELFSIGNVAKKKGNMIIFPSWHHHKVHPVTSGIRKTIVCWFTGPDWR